MNSLLFKEHSEFRTFFHGMLRPFQVRPAPARAGAAGSDSDGRSVLRSRLVAGVTECRSAAQAGQSPAGG